MKLYRLDDNKFIVTHEDKSIEGDLTKAIASMIYFGVETSEIEIAITELQTKQDHIAEFGIHKRFIYTKKIA